MQAPVDHHQILLSMGIDPATQGYSRHFNTHRTRTIDYAIVLDGEIDMLLDDTEIHVKAGDILVQQAPITPGSTTAPSPAASRSS